MVYLDYNATAPLKPAVRNRMAELLGEPFNASSVHTLGRAGKKLLEDARVAVAQAVSAFPNEVIFTASGTEANNWALRGFQERRVLASAVEHSSVVKSAPHELIPVDTSGSVRMDALEALLAAKPPALVSVMLANNETGVIQPIAEIATLCHKHGALLHTDAVQALGKISVDFGALGADMMTISGHKCGGPVGAAALVVKQNIAITPMFKGGGQELGRRAGTENIPAIAGLAVACEEFTHMQQLRGWLDAMEARLTAQGAIVFGGNAPRLPNTSCLAMPGVSQEVQLMHLDLAGIAVSAGSACSSGRIEPSHVLTAMGMKEQARHVIRISGGWGTTEEDIARFEKSWLQLRHRQLS